MNVSGKLWFLGHILRYSKSYSQSTSVVSSGYPDCTFKVLQPCNLGIPCPENVVGVQQLSGRIVVDVRKIISLFVVSGIHEDVEPDYELKCIFMKRFFLLLPLWLCAWCLRDVTGSKVIPCLLLRRYRNQRYRCACSGSAFQEKLLTAADVTLTKDLFYDTYTLEDTYPLQRIPCVLSNGM